MKEAVDVSMQHYV